MKAANNTTTKFIRPPYAHSALPLLTQAHVPRGILMQTLYRAVCSRRAAGSKSEAKFVAWLCNRLPVTMIDQAGNVHVDLRTGPQHRTMFTAHTDTVHHAGGPNAPRVDNTDPMRTLWRAGEGACLGADDGAGVAILADMINQGVPGYYVFFREEECGGIGSRWLSKKMPGLLKDLDRCVSFDRADTADVITHQGMGRCCSDSFALVLADMLTADDLSTAFSPCDTGVFTDSANLTEQIAECTNVSVGYKHQHGDGEYQDITFLQRLATQLRKVRWDELPVERDPSAPEPLQHWSTTRGGTSAVNNVWPAIHSNETYILIDALDDAARDRPQYLQSLVAEYMLPDDVDTARPHVHTGRLDTLQYRDYANGLDDGTYDYDEVLEILVDALYI